jgi:hypothetical protein
MILLILIQLVLVVSPPMSPLMQEAETIHFFESGPISGYGQCY